MACEENRRPRWRALMACNGGIDARGGGRYGMRWGITPCNAEWLLAPGPNGLYMDSVESIF